MSLYKKYRDLKSKPEFDLQLIATELDMSAKDLYAIATEEINDAIETEKFNDLFMSIVASGAQIVSFDDNTDMYEWGDNVLVLYQHLSNRMILCERRIAVDLEEIIYKYKG